MNGIKNYCSVFYIIIERVYEDHEHVVENLLLWTRDSCNRLFFLEKTEKYDLFINPQVSIKGNIFPCFKLCKKHKYKVCYYQIKYLDFVIYFFCLKSYFKTQ